ncbi:MAG: carboxylesterase family protein [Acidobacteriota bacterium]
MTLKHIRGFIAALILMICAASCSSSPELTTLVEVTGGTVEGVVQDGIYSFKGIPFAAPPVGDLRWKSPQPIIPWEGVKSAEAFAPGPMQDTSFGAILGGPQETSEDCLYLTVWTGAGRTDETRPVMVWIYGGGFGIGMTSTPTYDGTTLAKDGAVLVSVAYRVGPMGFLAHPELSAESGHGSGAYGIQDQIAGLQWVKENIAAFGGDPANVTIFGESAGGISVSMLTASPMAKGLFHRAISESGGSMAPPRMTLKEAEEQGKAYLSKLGADDIKTARALSAEEIQKNGTNSNEGGLFVTQPVTSEGFEKMIRSQYAAGADALLEAYPHATDAEAMQSARDIMRDSTFAWPTWAWASLQSRNGKNRAFVYYFDHRAPNSPEGANHGAEISYVFGNLATMGVLGPGSDTPEDEALSEMIRSYWFNFARTGDPNGEGLPEWPAFDEKGQTVLYIDTETGARKHPDLDKIRAFDAYFAQVRGETGTEE